MMLHAARPLVSCQLSRNSSRQLPLQHFTTFGSQQHVCSPISTISNIGSPCTLTHSRQLSTYSSRQCVVAAASKKSSASTSGKGFGSTTKTTPSKSASRANQNCPCGSGKSYQSCCGRYHQGLAAAPTPEALLRARFSAYAMQHIDYLVATTHKENPEHTGDPVTYARSLQRVARATEYIKINVIGPVQTEQASSSSSSSTSKPASDSSNGGVDPAAAGGVDGSDAYLRFSVDWKGKGDPGPPAVATETSHFRKVNGAWLYYAAVE